MINRPDMTNLPDDVRIYIENLEEELAKYQSSRKSSEPEGTSLPSKQAEPPTTLNLITITSNGLAKRTLRHQYQRQRRSGMGIFDIETSEEDPPSILVVADMDQSLLIFSNLGRAFRLPVQFLPETAIRDHGKSLIQKLGLLQEEKIVAALPDLAQGAIALLSESGMVRYLRHHVFGEYMRPGAAMFDPKKFGLLTAACHTPGDGDLFIVTRQGNAIRFSEKLVPPQGGVGIKVEAGDTAIAITAVYEDSVVFMVDSEGNGTLRLMRGFKPNKSPGGSGKIAMKTDCLIAAQAVDSNADIFLISRLAKIIRFRADEIPIKEGVVQGVNCMSLRADQVNAATTSLI